jgi:menaquinone-dependent protoporphyrinogen IX oxidase
MFSILLILKKKQFQMTNEKDIKKFEKKSQKPQNINNFTGALNVFSCYNYK